MKNGICLKCQSTNVRKMVTHDDRGEHGSSQLKLVTYDNPNAWIFKGSTYYPMFAMACFKCGFVEFYIETTP